MNLRDVPLYILGAGGHAHVLHDLLVCAGHKQVAFIDKDQEHTILGCGPDDILLALGFALDLTVRLQASDRFDGYLFPPLIHPAAWTAPSSKVYTGSQVMAGAVVQSRSKIGRFAIVNTRAAIDHDCIIGVGSHIAPGATLCGGVIVGVQTLVGANATVLPGLTIGHECVIGAGAVVTHDVPDGTTVMGVPARSMDVRLYQVAT